MGIIEDFVSEYERQYDYWEAAGSSVRSLIEAELNSAGLRAIVTSRAKSVDRLTDKLRQRDREHHYSSMTQIGADIVDRAGVRVALYFPGQIHETEQLIRSALNVVKVKTFPVASASERPAPRRFSGYGARHFHVHIPEKALSSANARYATALVEVQVASVLMHAWSEVEHDLVYKPLEGGLSPSELALLDQLNGLVLAGEIALEQLQKAADDRVAVAATPFRDHFDLGEFLRSRISARGRELTETALGRVDVLFEYLAEQAQATAAEIDPYLEQLEHDFERRPVAEQLADLMLSGHPDRYSAYRKAVSKARHPSNRLTAEQATPTDAAQRNVGDFILAWAELEALLASLLPEARSRSLHVILRAAHAQGIVTDQEHDQLDALRDLRNRLVHAQAVVITVTQLERGTRQLRKIKKRLSSG